MKVFSHIEEYDSKTNQVMLKDEDGRVWVAPIPYFGVLRAPQKDTPCLLLMMEGARSESAFPTEESVKLNCIAIPIYDETRFTEEPKTSPTLVGNVSSGGKINSYARATESEVVLSWKGETLRVDDMTRIENAEFNNPEFSYGGLSKTGPDFLLRHLPSFPYLIPELVFSGDILKQVRKLVQFLGDLR